MIPTTDTPASVTDSDGVPAAPRRRHNDRAITFALAASGLIAAFMQTVVTPIIPRLPVLLHAGGGDAAWVLTATLLAAAVTAPITGRLGDMFGKRRIVLILLLLTLAGSVVCAFSDSLAPMIVGRALQGIGLGVVALGISILRDVIHSRALGRAVALVSATLGVGGAIGLPAAAWIAENFDFHVLFWFSAALALIAMVLVWVFIPVAGPRAGGSFDFLGAVGFAIGVVGILLALSKGSTWGWGSAATVALLAGGVAVLLVWGALELRTPLPLVDLRLAAQRPVLFTNLGSITIGFAFFTVSAGLPVILEAPVGSGVGLGQGLLLSSLCLMPLGLVMFFIAPLAARVSAARGPRTSLSIGGLILVAGFLAAAFLHGELWQVVSLTIVAGLGIGFAYAAMPTQIMRAVSASETAAANGLNSVMRTFGSSLASAFVGLTLAANATTTSGVSVPTMGAFGTVFAVAAAVSAAGVILFISIPRTRRG
ncbi:MFS transporter [Lacisediminihabitans sp.]|uniref:MFS transporter n=1 Tax=Lacisediminihabitans sp. TaxID=2787631 RepID=UPI00374D859E